MKLGKSIIILGGDGYFGWSLGLAMANRTKQHVILVDNLIKRRWEKEIKVRPLLPYQLPAQRMRAYRKLFHKSNLAFEKADIADYRQIARLIHKYQPRCIINAAQQPSAPFSMIGPEHAKTTFTTNIITNLNTLWAIALCDKNIFYLKLGTSGSYMGLDLDYIPNNRVALRFQYQGKTRRIRKSWLPMQTTDFYHQSKITDFEISEMCAQLWNLRILTVQQSIIYGATIPENKKPSHQSLATRYNYDGVFGTVINRFICQTAIGHPLTVYGTGENEVGLISLQDTVSHFLLFSNFRVPAGRHAVEHNYTIRLPIKKIAQVIAGIAHRPVIHSVPHPRYEKSQKLRTKVEQSATVVINAKTLAAFTNEMKELYEFTRRYKHDINAKIIMPHVFWRHKYSKQ
ncbi:MAG: NAD-dependent epimerase/dehydratase family protein [Patescibacteria group bacterium]|jgi:UDP-sulfoquinovose synthase